MPKINITEADMKMFRQYIPEEKLNTLEERLLLASIPENKRVQVTLNTVDGDVEVTGYQLTEHWAITQSRDRNTLWRLTHCNSGMFAIEGTKNKIRLFWNNLDPTIVEEVDVKDEQELAKCSSFIEAVRSFTNYLY